MKALVGLLFFLIPFLICTFFAKSFHKEKIEDDLTRKVKHVLISYRSDLDFSDLEVTGHHLTKIGKLPPSESRREDLQEELDEIIGLYANLDFLAPPVLAPPSFHLAEQSDQSVILTGLVRNEEERAYLVGLASKPAAEGEPLREVIDELEMTEKVAVIEPKEKLSTLAPSLLSSAEEGFINWSPSELIVGGLLENEKQQSTILTNAGEVLPEDVSAQNELKVQAFEDLDFGFERKGNVVEVTGLLPDIETRRSLLNLVKSQANGSRVVDKTTLAVRPRSGWWTKNPESFVPAFLPATEGPAKLHYYHDRFVAEGVFPEESDFQNARKKVADVPTGKKRELKLSFVKKPEPTPEPEPEPEPEPVEMAAADALVGELKGLAVYFNSSSAWVKNSEHEKIDQAAKLILETKDVTQGLTVGGYADLRGNAKYNRSLSLERAKAVRDRLIAKGVPADRLTVNHFGEDTSETAKKDLWKSRRVEISLTKTPDQ